jgi:hypothetical protein
MWIYLRLFVLSPIITYHLSNIPNTIRINNWPLTTPQITIMRPPPALPKEVTSPRRFSRTLNGHHGKANVDSPCNQQDSFSHKSSSPACPHQGLLLNRVAVARYARIWARLGCCCTISCTMCLYIAAYSSPRPGDVHDNDRSNLGSLKGRNI